MLVEDEDLAISSKAEIRSPALDQNSAQKPAARRPHVDAIATAAVHITMDIALDAVRDAHISKSKEPSVDEEGLARIVRHIKSISAKLSAGGHYKCEALHGRLKENTHMVDALVKSVLPSPWIQSVSVM